MATPDKKQLWVDWTHDAMNGYSRPDGLEDIEEIVDDMAAVAVDYADAMLEEFEERFSGGTPRRRRSKKAKDDDEDE
jgi:hypothetical protein